MEQRTDFALLAPNDAADIKTARALAKSVCAYRPPKGILPGGGPKTFREDFGEALPDEAEKQALAESRFLIVICSPRTRPSAAIAAKLEYFAGLGRKANIIAVIVEGEPIDAFPPFFIEQKTVRRILPDGSLKEEVETIEPVASDLRAATPRAAKKLLDYETVRIVAALAGIHPDVLEQRHQKRRRRRAATTAAVVGGVCLALSAVFLYFGLTALHEGNIARKQTQVGAAMVERMFTELPAQFAGVPGAAAHVDDALLDGVDTLLGQQSENLGQVDVHGLLAQKPEDDALALIRKAAMWRRYGDAAAAAQLYAAGIGLSGLGEGYATAFLWGTEYVTTVVPQWLDGRYGQFVFQAGEGVPLATGDIIVSLDGQPLTTYDAYYDLLADLLPGALVPVEVLHTEGAGGVETVILSRDDLLTLYLAGV